MSKAKWIAENLKPGEHYAGLILGQNGEPDYHLFGLPQKFKGTWDECMAWAKSIGAELPNLRELGLLRVNAKEHYEPVWHWSSEQTSATNAFSQDFGSGITGTFAKSYKGVGRACRRLFL